MYGMKEALGTQWIVELDGCEQSSLEGVAYVEQALLESANQARACIVSHKFHQFSPYGVSGVLVLEQSHITIHTWPEHSYAAVDLFFCSDNIDVEAAFEVLRRRFQPQRIEVRQLKRDADRSCRSYTSRLAEVV